MERQKMKPVFKVKAKKNGSYVEVGVVWKNENRNGEVYYKVRFDALETLNECILVENKPKFV